MSKRNGPAGQVKLLIGHEPPREGEYPSSYQVGSVAAGVGKVSRIEYREDFYGDHSLGWFDIYVVDRVALSVSARAVAEIRYQETVSEQ